MTRTFQDSCRTDALNTVLNTTEFAVTATVTRPTGGTASMTANQRFSLMGLPPIPDGALSAYDRLQLSGLYRIGEGALLATSTDTIDGQAILDLEDELQGSTMFDPSGNRHTRMGRFITDIDAEITVDEVSGRNDTLTIDGEEWQCIRVEGRSQVSGLKTIVIRRDEKITTKLGRSRP
jgi:hypothetical protein